MTKSDSDLDALIVGAGPTGLVLATQLQSFGARFRIIDRLLDRTRESRALAVQARTLELLQMLGLGEPLVARGNTSTRLKLHLEGRVVAPVTLGDISAVDTRFPFILFVSQAETEDVLNDYLRARGVVIERGTELVSFEREDDGVQCLLQRDDGRQERLHTRFLAGCDGAHSAVRKGSGIEFEGGSYPQDFALGDIEADGPLEPKAINSFASGGGVAVFFPLGRPRTWRVVAMTADDQTDAEPGRTSSPGVVAALQLSELQDLVDPPTAGTIRVRDPAWLTRFHLHHRQIASAEGEPRLHNGPRPGDRLPDAEVLVNGRSTYLQQALAGPHLALLLCGDSRHWDSLQLDGLRERYGRVMATHCLSTTGSDGSLVDDKGNAFARLGVQQTAQYLVRPDGYIAFRCAGRTFEQLDRYLADWYVAAR